MKGASVSFTLFPSHKSSKYRCSVFSSYRKALTVLPMVLVWYLKNCNLLKVALWDPSVFFFIKDQFMEKHTCTRNDTFLFTQALSHIHPGEGKKSLKQFLRSIHDNEVRLNLLPLYVSKRFNFCPWSVTVRSHFCVFNCFPAAHANT